MLTPGYIKDRVAAAISTKFSTMCTSALCSKTQTQSVCYLNYPSGTTSSKQLAFKILERPRTVKLQFGFNTVFLKHVI